jgi:hypothetical protein
VSRSRRRTPISPNTLAETDKPYKAAEHRRERAAVRTALANEDETPDPRAFGDPRGADKDGKHWFGDRHPKLLRK